MHFYLKISVQHKKHARKNWVIKDLSKGLGEVHRYARGHHDRVALEYIADDQLVAHPQEVVALKIKDWAKRWVRQQGDQEARRALDAAVRAHRDMDSDSRSVATAEGVGRALRRTKGAAGLGGDWVGADTLKRCPDAAIEALADQYSSWLRLGILPVQLMYNIIKLLCKKDGSDRPISLMPMTIRVLFKALRGTTDEWLDGRQRHWDWAVRGSSALRAALAHKLMDELAAIEGMVRATWLWDVEKFYDSIRLHKLVDTALSYQYPADLLLLGLRCYLGPRMITWKGVAGFWMAPNTSVCAGCVRANDMARVTMYDILDSMHVAHPRATLGQFVDDCKASDEAKDDPAQWKRVDDMPIVRKMASVCIDFRELCFQSGLTLAADK